MESNSGITSNTSMYLIVIELDFLPTGLAVHNRSLPCPPLELLESQVKETEAQLVFHRRFCRLDKEKEKETNQI
jgi:hypothetical protein